MTENTKVRVSLDTQKAKSELRGFVREASRTAGQISGSVRGAIGRGLGVVGAGAAFGTGLAAVRGATESGIGDVIGEAFGGIGANIADFFLGDLDEKAKAARSAREETIQAFGAIAGHAGSIPPEARGFFESVQKLRLKEEEGRDLFQRDDDFRGPGIDKFIDRITTKLGELLVAAADHLAAQILPWR